jgi:hypothetical protein
MSQHQPSDWRYLAEQASNEMDPERLMELVTELNHVLGEQQDTSRKQRNQGEQPKSYRACA